MAIYFIQDKIDLSDPIIMGHSFGGATSLYALAKDDRFKYVLRHDYDITECAKNDSICLQTSRNIRRMDVSIKKRIQFKHQQAITIHQFTNFPHFC